MINEPSTSGRPWPIWMALGMNLVACIAAALLGAYMQRAIDAQERVEQAREARQEAFALEPDSRPTCHYVTAEKDVYECECFGLRILQWKDRATDDRPSKPDPER